MPEQIITLNKYQASVIIKNVFLGLTVPVGPDVVSPNKSDGDRQTYLDFFNFFTSISSSSMLRLFSFTIEETMLLKEPS